MLGDSRLHHNVAEWMADMKPRSTILVLAAVACFAARAQTQNPARQDQEHARGEALPPGVSVVFRGILIDAGCRDFSHYNLGLPPQALPAASAQANTNAPGANASASGVTVDARTLEVERLDVMPHQIADLASRQSDPTCAIKANTRAYALLMADGRVGDLDEGGNTFADAAVKSDSRGRAMLAGSGPGFKPSVMVTGHVQGARIVASAVRVVVH